MKLILEIETDHELEQVLKAFNRKTVRTRLSAGVRQQRLQILFDQCPIQLPKNFKFNREVLYERPSLR